MHEFGREAEQAMEAYVGKHFGSDCPHDCSEETEEKIRNLLKQEEKTMKKQNRRMNRWIGVIAACAVLMCSAVVVYAASPAVREYLNMLFLKEDSVQRLTEVPEGYTGIYTAEDLNNVRENLAGNYILMNDIVLTEADYKEGGIFEGRFVPIGNEAEPYQGIFNGNGYAVSGLVINGDYEYAGLFGYVRRQYQYSGEDTKHFISSGMIKNLAVVDSVICLEFDAMTSDGYQTVSDIHAGAVAGKADYVIGCYTENVELSVKLIDNWTNAERDYTGKAFIGGVVGEASIVDSCWSDADIVFDTEIDTAEVYTAGVAGVSFACVTSYFEGTIDSGNYPDYGVVGKIEYTVPVALTQTILEQFRENYEKINTGESDVPWDFEVQKLYAFYCEGQYIDTDMDVQYFLTASAENEILYFLDPGTKPREFRMLSEIIEKAFPSNTFQQFCIDNNLKCGYYYCYDLREDPDCTFEGFDTESIWYMADGRPQLRLFAGGTRALSTASIGERPRLGWQKGLFQVPIPGME